MTPDLPGKHYAVIEFDPVGFERTVARFESIALAFALIDGRRLRFPEREYRVVRQGLRTRESRQNMDAERVRQQA